MSDPDALSSDLAAPERALVIAAHPDDAEFCAGATLAKWARQGTEVHHLVLTDGSKGTWDPDEEPAELVRRRQDEQRAASAALGGTGVHFAGHVDGELVADVAARAELSRVLRELRPDVVLGHDPWRRYRLHPDHAAAGRICVEGIVAARDPFFHTDQLAAGLEPHRPAALLLFEADEVNHAERVTDADLLARIAALEAHQSQLRTTHLHRVRDQPGDPLERFRDGQRAELAANGERAGAELAELFHLIVDQL